MSLTRFGPDGQPLEDQSAPLGSSSKAFGSVFRLDSKTGMVPVAGSTASSTRVCCRFGLRSGIDNTFGLPGPQHVMLQVPFGV